jgi:hypothetical protein
MRFCGLIDHLKHFHALLQTDCSISPKFNFDLQISYIHLAAVAASRRKKLSCCLGGRLDALTPISLLKPEYRSLSMHQSAEFGNKVNKK